MKKLSVIAFSIMAAASILVLSADATVTGTPITFRNGEQVIENGSANYTLTDTSGKVLSQVSGALPDGKLTNGPWGGADMTNATPTRRDVTSTDGTSDFTSVASASQSAASPGCMDADKKAELDDITGFTVLYQYIVHSHWCWANGGIYNMHTGINWKHVDGSFHVDANCVGQDSQSCYGWFYNWRGNNMGGHYTSRQGKIHQDLCAPIIGCIWNVGTCYPRVQTWVNAGPYITAKPENNCS